MAAGASSVTGWDRTLSTQFAQRLALIAFATAVLRGLVCGADFFGTIQTALIAIGAFYALGWLVGEAARRLVEENLKVDLARQFGSAAGTETAAKSA